MPEVSSALMGGALWFTIGMGIFSVVITIYSLYLNWKQAKVNQQMDVLIDHTKGIRELIAFYGGGKIWKK